MFDSWRFKRLNNFRKNGFVISKRSGQSAASARNQSARLPVRIIPELVNRLQTRLASCASTVATIDGARYGYGRARARLATSISKSSFAGSIATGTVYAISLLLILYDKERRDRSGKGGTNCPIA
jgi:hypothetical protein